VKERLRQLPVIGTALEVQERYVSDAADPLAAAIAFFAFLSLFPLLLLSVSVAGFVLDDPADQLAVAERITEAIPGFEQTVEGEEDSQVAELLAGVVAQRGTIGVIGLVILLLSGLRVVNAAMVATRVVFRGAVLTGAGKKLRQVLALVALGLLALGSTLAASIAGTGLGMMPARLSWLLSLGLSFVLDVGLFLGAYTLLSPTAVLSVRDRVPGAILAGAGWTTLKVAGATWVGNQIEGANALYGALGSVIALMLLFYLAGRLYLYGAVLSAVRYERVHGPLVAPHQAEELGLDPTDGRQPDGRSRGRDDRDGPSTAVPQRDPEGPPPPPRMATSARPVDPGPRAAAGTISSSTRERLVVADAAGRPPGDDPAGPAEPGRDARTAVAFALAVGALAAGWRFLGGSDR
jgi:membrane protein